jgi:hypothetical protein
VRKGREGGVEEGLGDREGEGGVMGEEGGRSQGRGVGRLVYREEELGGYSTGKGRVGGHRDTYSTYCQLGNQAPLIN